MHLPWSHRSGRLVRSALAVVAATALFAAVPPPSAHAAPAEGAGADSGTAHLDAVERALREVSPGLEGSVWERTEGNALTSATDDPAGWLLQTPGCWGDSACADRRGTRVAAAYDWDDDKAWRHTGVSSMNGRTDQQGEQLTPADFRAVRDFAATRGGRPAAGHGEWLRSGRPAGPASRSASSRCSPG
ncbi:hypothetical protein [Kitasatospora sp. NPDC091207]|uniref:hypothetical protein n=1 Tax=Kitasatospora sp. NPDC091207 TaxID=3364083 RepID=UPI0037FCF91A